MYQAIYKCRLCGETKKDVTYNTEDGASLFMFDDAKKEVKHACVDGSIGVMDFQGCKKVGD